jgi:GR25 family glycosyltransferase involved in LPS biosynthesis
MKNVAASINRLIRNARLRFFGDIPAFVIVLKSDKERCSHVYGNVLSKLPICDILNATNAKKAEVDEFFRTETIFVDNSSADITYAKLACTISHIRVWKAIIAQDLERAIVFEDDVEIFDGFRSFVSKLQKQLPSNFDLVHLYVHHDRSEWLAHVRTTKKPYVTYIPRWGRSAYLLSRSGAKKLLLGFQTITRPGDQQMSDMAQAGLLSVYCASESYVNNLGQLSSTYKGERFRSNIWSE